MSAVYYLILACLTGYLLLKYLLPSLYGMDGYRSLPGKPVSIARWLVIFPASFLIGTLTVTWCVYLVSYFFRNTGRPLYYGNLLVLLPLTVLVVVLFFRESLIKREEGLRPFLFNGSGKLEFRFVAAVLAVSTFMMLLTFHVKDNNILIGLSVFSDFSPHMAMIRSFSHGLNFPTEYPFFADGTVRYHFMFQFLAGNLEYLGMRIDWAFNIPSILSYTSFLMLLFSTAYIITGRKAAGVLTGVFFFFRSSFAFFTYVKDIISDKANTSALISKILLNDDFIGKTPNESWGLWNQNVFVNQRHFAFGLGVMMIVILAVYPLFREMLSNIAAYRSAEAKRKEDSEERLTEAPAESVEETITGILADEPVETISDQDNIIPVNCALDNNEDNIPLNTYEESILEASDTPKADNVEITETSEPDWYETIRDELKEDDTGIGIDFKRISCKVGMFLCNKEVWLPRSILQPVIIGIMLGLLSFWNGAVVFAAMVVLFVLAIMSAHRLEYLIIAAIAVGISYLETGFFIGSGSSAVKPLITIGFIAENKSFAGIIAYLVEMLGLLPFVIAAAVFKSPKGTRWLSLAFIGPLIFAFTVQLTPDIAVNHKYIMIAVLLLDIIAADFILKLFRVKFTKAVAVILIVVMTLTGVVDIITVFNMNNPNNVHGKRPFSLQLDDPLTKWVEENTGPNEIFLTNTYYIHPLLISGRKIFLGWHYFSWSAGYNAIERENIAKEIFNADSRDKLIELLKQNRISYILVDNDLRNSQVYKVNEELLESTFEAVFSTAAANTVVYKVGALK